MHVVALKPRCRTAPVIPERRLGLVLGTAPTVVDFPTVDGRRLSEPVPAES